MRHLQPVIWSKGTFLSPQHLQRQERYVEDSASFYLNALNSSCWGFSDIVIDDAALSQGILSLEKAAGIFKDGLAFDIPISDPPPPARPLPECFPAGSTSCLFFLAIPIYQQGRMNVSLKGGRDSTRYTSRAVAVHDENDGSKERSIQIAAKNLLLHAENEDRHGSVQLGCVRINKTTAGKFQVDSTYIPPVIDVHANSRLMQTVDGMIEMLTTRSTQLSAMRQQENAKRAHFSAFDGAKFWMLCTVNTHLPALRHFFRTTGIHPGLVFSELSELAGALTTLSPNIAPQDLPLYRHDDLGTCFYQIDEKIRSMLDSVEPDDVIALPLKLDREGIYTTIIEKDAYFIQSQFYLAITSDLRVDDLIGRAPKLKASSMGDIDTLMNRALPGLTLNHILKPPSDIFRGHYQYFSIERDGPYWNSVQRSCNFAVHVPADIPQPHMELIIRLGNRF